MEPAEKKKINGQEIMVYGVNGLLGLVALWILTIDFLFGILAIALVIVNFFYFHEKLAEQE